MKTPQPAPTVSDPFLTKPMVAELLNCTPRTVERLVSMGALPKPIRIGPRMVRWRLSQLDQLRGEKRPRSA